MEIIDAMEKQVHSANGTGQLVDLLAIYLQIAPFLALIFQMGDTGNEHTGTATGGIVY